MFLDDGRPINARWAGALPFMAMQASHERKFAGRRSRPRSPGAAIPSIILAAPVVLLLPYPLSVPWR